MSFFTHALSWKISFTLHTGRVHGDAINQCTHTDTDTHTHTHTLVSRGQCYSCLNCYKSSVDRECQLANGGRNGVSHTRLCTHIHTHKHTDTSSAPGSIVRHHTRQLHDPTRTVNDGHFEPDQSSISSQSSVNAAAQCRGINVPTAQRDHNTASEGHSSSRALDSTLTAH